MKASCLIRVVRMRAVRNRAFVPRSHMIRTNLVRLALLSAGVAIVASCDARIPTATTVAGTGTSKGGSSNSKNPKAPTAVIDSPSVGTLVNRGDSILVTVRLHDDIGLKDVVINGVTQKGSPD